MANRKGSYLSDEAVKARCPENFPVPMGKSYALFTLPDGTPAQRPQNVLQALREIARNQNRPYQDLERMYKNNLALAKNELVVAIPQFSRNTLQVASIAMQGNGFVQAQGVPVPIPVPIPVPPKVKIDYDTILGELEPFGQNISKNIYRAIYYQAKASGANVSTFIPSEMDNPMSKKRRVDLFKRILEKTNIIETNDIDTIIRQNIAGTSANLAPPPSPIATPNPFAVLIEEPDP